MGSIKQKWAQILYNIRNPEYSEHEKEFKQQLNFKRLLFFIPFFDSCASVLAAVL